MRRRSNVGDVWSQGTMFVDGVAVNVALASVPTAHWAHVHLQVKSSTLSPLASPHPLPTGSDAEHPSSSATHARTYTVRAPWYKSIAELMHPRSQPA
jgi:hypothetical protein